MDEHLRPAQWVVAKALDLFADGVLEAWAASKKVGLNIEALKMELLQLQSTLEYAGRNELDHPATEELLHKVRDSAQNAKDMLDQLGYLRDHEDADQLGYLRDHEDADQQGEGGKLACLPRDCMPMLSKLLPCSFSPLGHGDGDGHRLPQIGHAEEEAQRLRFNRVDFSNRLKHIVEQLQRVERQVTEILQHCGGPMTMTVLDRAQHTRPISSSLCMEPKLYGRDHIMNTLIQHMTKGKFLASDLSVFPVVGPAGVGKTALIQHIYWKPEVQNHFPVTVWICVSLDFNLKKLLHEIKECIPEVEGEREGRTEELIIQRLKSKRFLLVLDDIWQFGDHHDWERLLLPLKTSQEKGSMILITTRFQVIPHKVRATSFLQLEGLEAEEFKKLFFTFVIGYEQYGRDHSFLLETAEKIMGKLMGSPRAAKTVGRLLRKELSLHHWERVLERKEWENLTDNDEIMPALKLSYDILPFQSQQCFLYSALFPEDFVFSSSQLINLWIGLDILQIGGQSQTLEDIGLSILNDLVMHGVFKKEEINGRPCYVMHDVQHALALRVASHECLTLRCSDVGSVVVHPNIRHLSIIIDGDSAVSVENFESELRRLKVEQLRTLMLFGEMDESFAKTFGGLFRDANALRVLHLHEMSYPVESILYNFSALVHLRYLFLGTKIGGLMHGFLCPGTEYESQMHLPLTISGFYDLRFLDLGSWYGRCDFPKDMSNLKRLCHVVTRKDELHSAICNVGKLKLLKELKVFRVNKESDGFEPEQLEDLTELSELGIYNLENVHTEEEAASVNLKKKKHLERLTLDWDSERSSTEPDVEEMVLETLQPHRHLQELCIGGHGGLYCPTWLGDKLAVEALESLHLSRVSWKVLPALGKLLDLRKVVLKHIATVKEFVIEDSFWRLFRVELVGLESFEGWVAPQNVDHLFPLLQVLIIRDCPKLLEFPFSNHIVYRPDQYWDIDYFPRLQELEIHNCWELSLVPPIPWTETLCSVSIRGVMLLEKLIYSNSSHGVRLDIVGKDGLDKLDQVLAFNNLTELEELALVKCPPLELKHLGMLTSLKTLTAESSDALVEPLGGQGDAEWQIPVEHIEVQELRGNSGKELTEFLTHLPRLSKFEITECAKITHLAVGVDQQKLTSAASEVEEDEEIPAAELEKEDGVLLFPAHLSNTLRELIISHCPELVLVAPPTLFPDSDRGGGLQALQCLERLQVKETPKFVSAYLFASPSCRLFPSSLQFLELNGVEGMGTVEPLSNLTSLTLLELRNCGEDLRCKGLGPLLTAGGKLSALIVYGSPRFFAGWDPNPRQSLQAGIPPSSSKLQKLWTDDVVGFLAMPICSFLSSSLAQLQLCGNKEMERFSNEQEDALHLLASLYELEFYGFNKLQHLPTGLRYLTRLTELHVGRCPSVRSLPEDGLPRSLQKLDVCDCGNKKLIQQCSGLVETIPKARLEF